MMLSVDKIRLNVSNWINNSYSQLMHIRYSVKWPKTMVQVCRLMFFLLERKQMMETNIEKYPGGVFPYISPYIWVSSCLKERRRNGKGFGFLMDPSSFYTQISSGNINVMKKKKKKNLTILDILDIFWTILDPIGPYGLKPRAWFPNLRWYQIQKLGFISNIPSRSSLLWIAFGSGGLFSAGALENAFFRPK